MKRSLFLLVLVVVGALPVFAQETHEFGVIIGGSRRFVDGAPHPSDDDFIESNFSFGNTSIELYWSTPLEQEVNFKLKGGVLDTQIAIPYELPDPEAPGETITNRRDVEGEVSHIESIVEYEFDEPWGSSALFGGIGYYRLSAPDEESRSTWGIIAGVNSDFPLTRRYGIILEASYHWTHSAFQPRYMTLGGGMRISF